MNWKRSLLAILTILSMYSVFFALSQSLGEPQVQAQLELYQTNLILNASSWNPSQENISSISQNLIGENPLSIARSSYEKALTLTQDSLNKLKENEDSIATETPRQQLKKSIIQNEKLIDELNLKLGIILAEENNLDLATNYWQQISNKNISETLSDIWVKQAYFDEKLEEKITNKLDSWFKLKILEKNYNNANNQIKVEEIIYQQQNLAEKAIYRLFTLSLIPVFGGIIGFGLIIFLLIQLLTKKQDSILAINYNISWESPWDWEIIWQVFIVGFFFLSQVLLPIIFGIGGFNPAVLGIKGKALYVLLSYFLMAGGGLLVLYLSLKPFFPLPQDWFKITNKNWYWWGIGGYLVAIPSVFFVSILNQQLWQGRGGSNPLLLLALESQDKFALAIFFITASIAAPIFEEIMFRGFLLPSLTRYLPVWGAIIVSGVIFAIAHLSLAETIPLATLGIILGIVYTRSRSLLASIILHSLWNSGTLFSLFLLGSKLT
ncbi:CPBP family intramembrane glutamic endopeptidase [Geminocystis sp. NIES-3709]|uniref:CPBP family intramembrane glutamic endopeptidase n=1 Tax=Geminocystis sp. NIES-3709 TaxID=1617448 RepID=UPI0005FCA89E|nr:type II CAAX endopeptidase family protein [Geminocystis sp. NIES-3709]BAQ65029.1 possible membrane associated protease [Geminocystis sp. NIES-3709]